MRKQIVVLIIALTVFVLFGCGPSKSKLESEAIKIASDLLAEEGYNDATVNSIKTVEYTKYINYLTAVFIITIPNNSTQQYVPGQ